MSNLKAGDKAIIIAGENSGKIVLCISDMFKPEPVKDKNVDVFVCVGKMWFWGQAILL